MREPARRTVSRAAVLAGLAVAATPLVGLSPAYACSCVAATDAESLESADVVFKGLLVKRQVGRTYATYVFDVQRTYKGKAADPQRVRTASSGAACGLEVSGKGPFLVFAYKQPGTKKPVLAAGLCGGTRPIGAKEEPAFARTKPPSKPAPSKPAPAKPAPSKPGSGPAQPEAVPELPGAPEVPIVPFDPLAPAERATLQQANRIARDAQDFVNRLVGPLFG